MYTVCVHVHVGTCMYVLCMLLCIIYVFFNPIAPDDSGSERWLELLVIISIIIY